MADTIQHTAADQADGQTTLVEYEATAHHTIVWDDSGGHTHSGTGSTGKPITGIGAATMSGDIAGGENNISNITLYGIHNIGTGDYDVQLKSNQTLTSNRILFLNVGDASRTLTIGGNVNFGNAWTTSGAYGTTITITGTTNITFPTSGTLASLAGTETLTNKTLGATSFSGNVSLGDNTITDVAGIDFEVGSGDGYISTSTTANEALIVQCRDVDGSAWVQAINLKPHNSPTFTLGSTGFATQTIAGTWATSTFILGATKLSGNLDMDGNSITGNLLLQGPVGGNMLIVSKQDTANALGIYTPSGGADTLRLLIGNGATAVATWSNVTHTGMVMSGGLNHGGFGLTNTGNIDFINGAFLRPSASATHTCGIKSYDVDGAAWVDAVLITVNNDPSMTLGSAGLTGGISVASTVDFTSQSVINVGASGNDFGATNTLVGTTFSGSVTIDVAADQQLKLSSGRGIAWGGTLRLYHDGTDMLITNIGSFMPDNDGNDHLGGASNQWNNVFYSGTLTGGGATFSTAIQVGNSISGTAGLGYVWIEGVSREGASVIIKGQRTTSSGDDVLIYTDNGSGGETVRLKFSGFENTAVATWNAVTHTGMEITSGSNITFGSSAIIAGSGTDTFHITGHFKPVANKSWDMGSTGLRWRDVFTANAVSSGTSRIVETSSICPKCEGDIPTVRSTGGILSVGDEYDYTESHCPVCLTMVAEKLNQRPDIEIDNPESIVLTDVIVKAQSGNTRSIGLKFLFNDTDINVGYLSEKEIQIFENGDNDAIENIIKDVAMDEWRSLKRAELMETHTKELGEQFKDYTSDWLGKEININ